MTPNWLPMPLVHGAAAMNTPLEKVKEPGPMRWRTMTSFEPKVFVRFKVRQAPGAGSFNLGRRQSSLEEKEAVSLREKRALNFQADCFWQRFGPALPYESSK